LENKGDFKMGAHPFSMAKLGRWFTMSAGDWEGGEDVDILLGSLMMEVLGYPNLIDQWIENAIPFLIMENKLK
jgi:hypothetical protein